MTTFPCQLCDIPKSKHICATCLRKGVAEHAEIARSFRAQSAKAVSHAESLLNGRITTGSTAAPVPGANDWRQLRASVAAAEDRCASLRAQIAAQSKEIKKARDYVAISDVRSRREVLEVARRGRLSHDDLRAQIALVRQQQREVGKRIIQARRVLVREVIDVFGVQEVQRRHGMVWEIAGMEFPAPERFRLFTSLAINAVLGHTIHLLSLITGYLSITLPYVPVFPPPSTGGPPLPHVGRPLVEANIPFITTTKWRGSYLFWMSSTASVAGKSKRGTADGQQPARTNKRHLATLEAFALLAHSVAYLAFTQGVQGIGIRDGESVRDSDDEDDVMPLPVASGPLVAPTSILELISLIAVSPTLGLRAHEPGTSDTLRHMGFGLDVKRVVRAVFKAEKAQWGVRGGEDGQEQLSEGWDLMEMDA